MKFLSKVIITVIIFIFFCAPSKVSASSNFTTDYHVTYAIDENGMAHATVNGSLTNTTSQYYATSYKIQFGFDTISNIQAHDAKGSIAPQVTKSSDGYIIALNFNNQAVGLDKKQQFTITFDTPTLAHHYGKIWEIDIPGISNPEDFSTFVVALQTPPSFGQPAYIKPNKVSNSLIFDKQTLGRSGISLAFGDSQVYKFHLTYHLRNSNLYPVTQQIALPPSTNYQDVSILSISPLPNNVIEDKDGNWLAQYHLSSAQAMDVIVDGDAAVHLIPKQELVSSTDLQEYIKPQKYWETNNNSIQELTNQLRTPQSIYLYVINKLHYDFSRVTSDKPRLGAVGALQNPNSAVCREFTDLFITLSRAAGIPAREVDGFAATDNPKQRPISLEKDVLHVWPEYYDSQKKTWIMVDPTWGSTTGGVDYFNTLDFDHFAFAIKGESSEIPIPAGGYKFTNEPISKDVQIGFSTEFPQQMPTFSFENQIPSVGVAGLPIQGDIIIKNTSSVYVPSQTILISSDIFTPQTQTIQSIGIPPFGTVQVPVSFHPTNALTNTNGTYTIRIAGISTTKQIQSKLFFLTPWGGGITGGIFAIIIFIITFKSWGLRIFR